MESHLLQMRGLKLSQCHQGTGANQVASFTDAWIETNMSIEFNAGLQSHLLQMRGLKLDWKFLLNCVLVASFTDAWIETIGANKRQKRAIVASFTDAWIET